MIQAIGLTSLPRRHQLRPAVDDLTFEAAPGRVTVLLGPESSGKTTALRLMLQLQTGRGTALFRGRPVHRIQYPAREVGLLLSEVNGHPGRTARGHLRMLAAAAGVPAARADEVLDVVGLSGLADQRMSTLSRGMDRRLGMACALLGDPHTLVLDEPARELSPRETAWLYSLIRGYAHQGGTVLVTSRQAEEAAQLADRVVSIDAGRLLADQEVADFARTRLRPRVAVRTPHAERLASVLTQEGRKAGRDRDGGPLKVVREDGTRVSVYGSSCAEVGEWAHRNGILVHQLADERGDAGDLHVPEPLERADGRSPGETADAGSTDTTAARPTAVQEPPESAEPGDLDEIEEFAKFEEDAATTDETAAPDGPASVDSPAVAGTSDAVAAVTASPPSTATDPADADLDPDSQAEASGSSSGDEPHPEPDPESEAVPEPVLVASSSAPLAPEAAVAAEEQTLRISDTPLDPAPAPEPDSDPASTAATDTEPDTAIDTATDTATDTEPDSPHDPDEAPAPAPPPRILLKPLADPDARRALKSLWTPEPSAPSAAAELPPQLHAIPRPGPAAPLRYELCRLFSVRSTWIALAVTVTVALCVSLVMARTGLGLPSGADGSPAPAVRLLTGWPSGSVFLLPPVAVAAGLLGAFAFGEEFRYPALAPARSPVPRRLSLLAAKLAVSALLAVLLSIVVAAVNWAGVTLLFGAEALALPGDVPSASGGGTWRLHIAAVFAFAAGCAWAGVLAAGIFRSGAVGTAVVVAVPLLLAPLAGALFGEGAGGVSGSGPAAGPASPRGAAAGLPETLEAALLMPWPPGTQRWAATVLELVSQPVGSALALSLAALLAGYLVVALNSRAR